MLLKRGGKARVALVGSEIFLLIMSTIAIAFIVGEGNSVLAASSGGGFVYGNAYSTNDGFVHVPELTTGTEMVMTQEEYTIFQQDLASSPAPSRGAATTPGGLPVAGGTPGAGGALAAGGGKINLEGIKKITEKYGGSEEQIARIMEKSARWNAEGNLAQREAEIIEGYKAEGLTESQAKEVYGVLKSGTSQTSTYSYSPYGLFSIKNFFLGNLVEGLVWSIAAVGAIQLIGRLVTKDTKLVNALSAAAFAGIMAGKAAYGLFGEATKDIGSGGILGTSITPLQAGLIGVGVAAVVFILLYKKEKKKVVELQCLPWEAPTGGADCEKCNADPLKPCSEYRCKALGQACELVNKGSNEERCVWVARNDVNSPTITPWRDVLTPRHDYTPLQTRPAALGTRIVSDETTSKCIKPFTPLQFGAITNEPSQCKIDVENNKTFDDMAYYFGESNLFRYNHTQQLRLPSPDSLRVEGEAIDVPTEGLYNFYVRCRDANGNVNVDEFVFNLCVDKSPDATPPIIEETSITSGSPVSFGTQTVPLAVYVNEPAECKWSIQDKAYSSMENNMSCSTHVYEQNARQQYPCQTNLTGIRDSAVNTFFFRCKDQPLHNESERNVNQESYRFTLRGSQTLNILNVGPNGTFTGGTDVIALNLTVRTDDGSDEGVAICSFSSTGVEGTFIGMFETDSYQHRQTLTLGSGNYTYFFRCVDAGGNAATANTTFRVVTDRAVPRITRLYHESDILRVITNEDATCTYSLTSCNYVFTEGIEMIILNSQLQFIHAAPWRPHQTYYIKCRDGYGNMPGPNECSVIASASNVL